VSRFPTAAPIIPGAMMATTGVMEHSPCGQANVLARLDLGKAVDRFAGRCHMRGKGCPAPNSGRGAPLGNPRLFSALLPAKTALQRCCDSRTLQNQEPGNTRAS